MQIDLGMQERIQKKLTAIETENNVRILFAIESGSRGWGFSSADSDYDVRFVYVRKLADYISFNPPRDVIEIPVDKVLDINGWDLQKTLKLGIKSNAVIWEWLQSPIVYRENRETMAKIRQVLDPFFSMKKSAHHYFSMFKAMADALAEPRIKVKKYFYILRPLLALKWIVERNGIPPMTFGELRRLITGRDELKEVIDRLLKLKRSSYEADEIEADPTIHRFIKVERDKLEQSLENLPVAGGDVAQLDRLFLNLIRE